MCVVVDGSKYLGIETSESSTSRRIFYFNLTVCFDQRIQVCPATTPRTFAAVICVADELLPVEYSKRTKAVPRNVTSEYNTTFICSELLLQLRILEKTDVH